MSDVTPESIIKLALCFMAAKHLLIANEIGMFEKLSKGSLTLEALAEGVVVPSGTTRIVADAMVSLGLLQRQGDPITTLKSLQFFSVAPPAPGYARSCAS